MQEVPATKHLDRVVPEPELGPDGRLMHFVQPSLQEHHITVAVSAVVSA